MTDGKVLCINCVEWIASATEIELLESEHCDPLIRLRVPESSIRDGNHGKANEDDNIKGGDNFYDQPCEEC